MSVFFQSNKNVPELDNLKKFYIEFSDEVLQYALDNPDRIIVVPNALFYSTDPFVVYPGEKPVNLLEWGSLSDKTPLVESKFKNIGIDNATPSFFLLENVYYASYSQDLNKQVFSYLQTRIPITKIISDYSFSKGYPLIQFR